MATKIDLRAIDAVIKRNLRALRKPGVLSVRPGYKLAGGSVTDLPSIVVTVERKLARPRAADRLPAQIAGVPVDVRQATGLQRLRARDPAKHALLAAHGRSEHREPAWPLERRASDGKLSAQLHKSAQPKKPQLPYTPAPGQALDPVTRTMTIIAHASPDDGFPVLADFLAQTRSRLAVGMYDFTSAGILRVLQKAIAPGGKQFHMVLDHPPRNPTANQSDDQTSAAILQADRNSRIAWALTRMDPKASKWIFPTSYHIKVAVRDGEAFWLSSGNWNVSNQPDFAANDPAAGSLSNCDRDWHVVVMDAGLARLYEAYIEHDLSVASGAQSAGDPALRKKIQGALKAHAAQASRSPAAGRGEPPMIPSTLGKQRVFSNVQVTVQPLLTPDKGKLTSLYVDKVLALLNSARRSVYLQMQYVYPNNQPQNSHFTLLIGALRDALGRGLDVRLITSQYENTAQWIETLKPFGLDRVLRIQQRVHNKGIVVDSKIVLVSSQNWSADGTLFNRDAGLIIEHAGIAQYFEAIFLDDWEKRATPKLA